MALKYNKHLQFQIISTFKNNYNNIIVLFINAKKPLIQRSVFLKLVTNFIKLLVISFGFIHIKIIQ